MGIIFIANMWGKVRPVIKVEAKPKKKWFGISHTKKEPAIQIKSEDVINFEIDPDEVSWAMPCNAPKTIYKQIGETKEELDERLQEIT